MPLALADFHHGPTNDFELTTWTSISLLQFRDCAIGFWLMSFNQLTFRTVCQSSSHFLTLGFWHSPKMFYCCMVCLLLTQCSIVPIPLIEWDRLVRDRHVAGERPKTSTHWQHWSSEGYLASGLRKWQKAKKIQQKTKQNIMFYLG